MFSFVEVIAYMIFCEGLLQDVGVPLSSVRVYLGQASVDFHPRFASLVCIGAPRVIEQIVSKDNVQKVLV